jgi:hypothetical protein
MLRHQIWPPSLAWSIPQRFQLTEESTEQNPGNTPIHGPRLALMRESPVMAELPTKEQLVAELGEFVRAGLGRPRKGLTEAAIPGLMELGNALLEKAPDEQWAVRVARLVIGQILRIENEQMRLALGDIFGLELEGDRATDDVLEDVKTGLAVAGLEGHGGRYQQAGQRFKNPGKKNGYAESYVRDTLKGQWLGEVADQLLKHAKDHLSLVPQPEAEQAEAPVRLVAGIGAALIIVGAAWLVAVATGLVG